MEAPETLYETLLVEQQDAVVTVTLNRPDRLNALSDRLDSELRTALTWIALDDQVRAVILTGAGRGFCSGADLSLFNPPPSPEQVYLHLTSRYLPIIDLLTSMQKPVLGAVNGIAAGAGCSLALACDLRVMSTDAALSQAFSNIGFVPDAGSTWLLARQLGYSRAYELAIEGRPLPAERCLELGLTNRVVSPDTLMSATHTWAQRLAERPTLALGLTKKAMYAAMSSTLKEAVEFEARLQQHCAVSEDFVEGVAALVEKRPPSFKGR